MLPVNINYSHRLEFFDLAGNSLKWNTFFPSVKMLNKSIFTVEYQPVKNLKNCHKIQDCSFKFIFSLAFKNILP